MAPFAWISCAARPRAHVDQHEGTPSMSPISMPYMKPSWCASGEGMKIIAPSEVHVLANSQTALSSVLEVCSTPFDSPVVPEV